MVPEWMLTPPDRLRAEHGYAWRIKVAENIAYAQTRYTVTDLDALTIETAQYLIALAAGGRPAEQASETGAHIAAAILLNSNRAQVDPIKLLILVDTPAATIAERLGLESQVVTTWERLYFDLRSMLPAIDWVARELIDHEREFGDPALAAKMKLALGAGPTGVDAILALDQRAPLDAAGRLFDRRLKLDLKLSQAVNLPLKTPEQNLEFAALALRLRIEEGKLDFEKRRLEARCLAAQQRMELAKIRASQAAKKTSRSNQRSSGLSSKPHAKRTSRAQRAALRPHPTASSGEFSSRASDSQPIARRMADSPLAKLRWFTATAPQVLPEPQNLPLREIVTRVVEIEVPPAGDVGIADNRLSAPQPISVICQ